MSHDGLWTVALQVWDVGDGGVGGGNAPSTDSSYWHGSLSGVGDRRIYVPDFALSRGQPNPSSNWVAWDIRRQSGGKVNLRVVGVDGRRVKSWSEKTIPAGPTRILWDGRDDQGQRVASGRYFLVVTDETGHMRTNAATVVR